MSSQFLSNADLVEDEDNEVNDIEVEEIEQEEEQEESKEELNKLDKRQKEKESFVKQIKSVEKIHTNLKFESIGSKINQLLETAEQYASFLLTRHKQVQKRALQTQFKSRHRVVVDNDDEKELDQDSENAPTRLNKQPSILKGGELKDYQLTGLNWLISLYETGINGILADEMGLGKTIQTIALIGFLKEFKRIGGPHLVVAPKSTLGNWMKEFKKWLPCCRVVKLIALKEERDELINKYLQPGKFDVCLTSYEGVNICLRHIRRFQFKYIIIDEAHKIKNEEAMISQNMRKIRTNYKLLLSGTPLQNTPHELWSLLNYLLPDLFDSSEVFDKWFEVNAEAKAGTGQPMDKISQEDLEQKNLEMVQKFHKILRPFMLRRTKAEVEKQLPPKKEIHLFVKTTQLQRSMYQNIIISNNPFEGGEDKTFYMNKLMQLRKICLHPYLFPEVEDKDLPALGEHLIEASGKLRVLDKFLVKLATEKHQVLIFSQFTMMLNILEDYCNFRGYEYCRIDGDTEIECRDDQIADFTSPNTTKTIFLLSTRAGGLGINLATADTVIIYDSDFNPQMDLQAMDRAHRIGQKSQVMVYRLVCEHTVEEKIIERQQIKLRWDSLMIQQGRMHHKGGRLLNKDELKEITQYGASHIFKLESEEIKDEDIDLLLERGKQRTNELNESIDKRFQRLREKNLDLGLGQINIFDYFEENKKTIKEDEEALDEAMALQMHMENKTRRDKKSLNYNLNHMFNAQVGHKQKVTGKQIKLQEHHLYKDREKLQTLLQKEEDYVTQQKFIKKFGSHTEKEEEQEHSQEIDQGGLSTEERLEVQELLASGFIDWTRIEFNDFIIGSEKYGRNCVEQIQDVVKTKSVEEVTNFMSAFWSRLNELSEKEKYVKQIERGEKMLNQRTEGQRLIEEKCKQFHFPRHELVFTPQLYNKFKSKYFSQENDKYLIFLVNEVGYGNWTSLKKSIRKEAMFRFDHAFKCKSENELKNRITSLLKVLEKEKENNCLGRPVTKSQPSDKPKAQQTDQKIVRKVGQQIKQEELQKPQEVKGKTQGKIDQIFQKVKPVQVETPTKSNKLVDLTPKSDQVDKKIVKIPNKKTNKLKTDTDPKLSKLAEGLEKIEKKVRPNGDSGKK